MQCQSPIQISRPDGFKQLVPCGHCLNCSIKRQQAWTLRICLEASEHASSSFVTLTYNEDTRPGRLEYQHIALFLKRWRKSIGAVRFFCVGEYGKRTSREHWHLIMFGVHPWLMGQQVISLWPHGFCHVGEVTRQSASYTARYSLKTGVKGGEYVCNSSRRPGIGLDAIQQIGASLAQSNPQLPCPPLYWRYGGSTVALDKSSRDRFIAGYKNAGGIFLKEGVSPLRLDLDAKLYAIAGEPGDRAQRKQIIKLENDEVTRGTF